MNQERIYNKPRYYHAAFLDAGKCELEIINRYAGDPQDGGTRRILEPACGSGRLLVPLAEFGYEIVGYDLSDEMVQWASRLLKERGLQGEAQVVLGDMVSMRMDNKFDLAINAINSIRYLIDDQDYIRHFRNTAGSLKSGGVYIIHLSTAHLEFPGEDYSDWDIDFDGIRGTVKWGCSSEDPKSMKAFEYFEIDAWDNGTRVAFRDDHELRFMRHEDLRRLIAESGCFDLEAVYSESLDPVDLATRVTAEMGNHYYILRRND